MEFAVLVAFVFGPYIHQATLQQNMDALLEEYAFAQLLNHILIDEAVHIFEVSIHVYAMKIFF